MNIQNLIRKSVSKLSPSFPTIADVPISDAKQMAGVKEIAKLSANEHPFGPSPKAIAAMNEALQDMNRYPDSMARALRGTIGKKINLDPRHVILSSGLESGLQLLTETVLEKGDEVIIPQHSPSLYSRMAQRMDAVIVPAALSNGKLSFPDIQKLVTPQTKLIVLGNPLDPTGTFFSAAELQTFLMNLPQDVVVAIDESYGDFAPPTEYPTAAEFVKDFPNLVILRSFSSFFGLAAARIGYLVTSLELGGYVNRLRLPFAISSVSQVGALASLLDVEYQQQTMECVDQGKAFLYGLFEEMNLSYTPSHGNFVLVDIGHESSKVLNALVKKGVLVRTIDSLPTHIRVSVGKQEELDHFAWALREVLDSF